MKNNKIMKAAAGMMALTLMTSCFVGGTFAKYVTKAESESKARVAKFGVTLAVENEDEFFKSSYENTENTVTVESANQTDKVVAPGTASKEDHALKFSIKGKPEVAVKVGIKFDENVMKDIYLKSGSYKDWTSAPYEEDFTLNEEYHPVVFTLKLVEDNSETIPEGGKVLVTGTLKEIQTYLNNDYLSGTKATYAPNTDIGATFEISWKWDFEQEATEKDTADAFNAADTLLGNLVVDSKQEAKQFQESKLSETSTTEDGNTKTFEEISAEDYSVDIAYGLTLSVTQVD